MKRLLIILRGCWRHFLCGRCPECDGTALGVNDCLVCRAGVEHPASKGVLIGSKEVRAEHWRRFRTIYS